MAGLRTISLDAMGGDRGPAAVVPGAALALQRHNDMTFLLFGDQARIQPYLDQEPSLAGRTRIVHTDTVIGGEDKPSQALRRGKGTSMWLALEAVQKGEAECCISGGNTGALMAISRLILKTMPGIERPVIAGQWPTVRDNCIVLDLGATIGATASQLAGYALMGGAMARALFHRERPRVGLLNIGEEEIKGIEEVKQAHALLKETTGLPIDYHGFIEGDQIGQGIVDVVVVEGYAGNIALKTAEGTARQMATYVREALTSSLPAKIGAFLAQGGLRKLRDRMDPRGFNGGPFLGLNGIVIKSHGGMDAYGFSSAICVGYDMADSGLIAHLTADLAALHGKISDTDESVEAGSAASSADGAGGSTGSGPTEAKQV